MNLGRVKFSRTSQNQNERGFNLKKQLAGIKSPSGQTIIANYDPVSEVVNTIKEEPF